MVDNFDRAWETKKIVLDDFVGLAAGDYDPAIVGHGGLVGALFFRADGRTYVKTGAGDTDWQLGHKLSRNYSDIEYFLIHNLFHAMSESHAESIYNIDITRNMYIDSFQNTDLISELNGTDLTGNSCVISLNRLYSSTLAGDTFESEATLVRCYHEDCSTDTWLDSTAQYAPTVGADGFDPYAGTYVGRMARKAGVGTYIDYWTCLLSTDVANIGITTDSITVKVLIKTGGFPADVSEMPITLHLHSQGATEYEFYTSTQTITGDTGSAWVEYRFSVANCEFLDTITHAGIAIGKGINSAYDFEIFVDNMEFVNGTVRNTHGSFTRTTLTTDYDVASVLIDRKTYQPNEIGRISNHISLDGGAHYKMNMPLDLFISTETGEYLEAPDAIRLKAQLLTQDAIAFRYLLPSGGDSVEHLEVYPGTDSEEILSIAGHVSDDDFSTDTLADYVEYGTGTATYQAGTQDLDLAESGNDRQLLLIQEVAQAGHQIDQYIHADVSISRVANVYDVGGLILRAGTSKTDKGYFAAILTNSAGNTRFVIGRDQTIHVTGTYTGIVADTPYLIEIAVHDLTGTSAELSARFWDVGRTTVHDSLTWTDTARITSGNFGLFAGSMGGNSGGQDVVVTFDTLEQHCGFGEYTYYAGTPDFIDFIPGREPTGDLRSNYFVPFTGAWDNKKNIVIVADFDKELRYIELDTTPEIDDFLLIAKVTEI